MSDTILPQGDDLAQEANDYANEAIAASKYTIPPGAWRSLLRDMVQEAYLDGFRRVRDANQTTLLERTSQPEDAVPLFGLAPFIADVIRDELRECDHDEWTPESLAEEILKRLRDEPSATVQAQDAIPAKIKEAVELVDRFLGKVEPAEDSYVWDALETLQGYVDGR